MGGAVAGSQPELEVRRLTTRLYAGSRVATPVDDVSLAVKAGETLGLLGESGCGKSMTLFSIMRLLPRSAKTVAGEILLKGEDLLTKTPREMRQYRGRQLAMILQDPLSALNPVFSVGYQLREALALHAGLLGKAASRRAADLLRDLRVASAETRLASYPHQLSGGMRQRVVGAIAMAGRPSVLLADEPTTSLDVTIQAVFLDVLKELQASTGLAIVFVTHDVGVVADICHRVAVMYAGRIIETASTSTLVEAPAHPYTQALLAALPDMSGRPLRQIEGQPPSLFDLPAGCPFAARCKHATEQCRQQMPAETVVGPGHSVRCWLYA